MIVTNIIDLSFGHCFLLMIQRWPSDKLTVCVQIFEVCRFQRMPQIQLFREYIFKDHQPFKIHRFCEHSLTNVLHTDIVTHYLLLSRTRSRSLHLETCRLISGLMYRNCPQNISQSTIGAMQGKSMSSSVASVRHHCSSVSCSPIDTSESFANEISRIKFCR